MLYECAGIKKIVLVTGRTDLRRGIDKLASLIRLNYGLNPLEDGTLFIFQGKKRDRFKGLIYEHGGYLLIYMRLTDGVFQWPRNREEALALDKRAFRQLLDGFTVESSIRFPKRDDSQRVK